MKELVIGNKIAKIPIIQGGMGVGVSRSSLAGAVAAAGGVGIISSAQIGFDEDDFLTDHKTANKRALIKHIKAAKAQSNGGLVGANVLTQKTEYGTYIVKESEKQEDTLSYKITCYDKMLYSMKDYEHIDITYPCTIKQYLVALCNKIGLQFKDSDFANANRQITNELFMTINEDGTYSSMGYTYRDVLDQIAETTGGCICITLDDKVEVRYINETNDTIDEEYINDVNVIFGEKDRTN